MSSFLVFGVRGDDNRCLTKIGKLLYQISPSLPQGARSFTEEEEEEEEDDEKIQKSRMRKICSGGNTKASTSLKVLLELQMGLSIVAVCF